MNAREKRFTPALRFRWLTRFYDPVLRATLKEDRFRGLLVDQAAIRPGDRVLDVGCGTGSLSILIKRTRPEARVMGLDIDPEVLAIAGRKADEAGVEVEWMRGAAWEPALPDGSVDRVVTCLVLHHLSPDDKVRALRRAYALLRDGGQIHVADWGRAQNAAMRVAFLGVQLLDGFATTRENVAGKIPALLMQAGFSEVEETHHEMTMFGTLALYCGTRRLE